MQAQDAPKTNKTLTSRSKHVICILDSMSSEVLPWSFSSPVLGLAHVAIHDEPEPRIRVRRRSCLEAAQGLMAADLVHVPPPRLLHQRYRLTVRQNLPPKPCIRRCELPVVWCQLFGAQDSRLTRFGRTTL